MKSVKTFQSSIQKTLTRKNTSTDMIGEEVEEYCRIATGKALPGPDDDLNRQVKAPVQSRCGFWSQLHFLWAWEDSLTLWLATGSGGSQHMQARICQRICESQMCC